MRHRALAVIGSFTACVALSGCFGLGSSKPVADHPRRHHSPSAPAPTSSAPTTGPTSPTTSPSAPTSSTTPASTVLRFNPRSAGRHSHTCIQVTSTAPVDYVYYPVLVKATEPVTLDNLSVTYADGVQVAGAWVAPGTATAGTGLLEGWPAPSILTQSSSVQWNKKVTAAGAQLTPASGWYNVFLHLRVYPDALPLKTDGVVLTLHTSSGSETDTWVDHVTYQSGKCTTG